MSHHTQEDITQAIRDTLGGNAEAYTLIVTTYMDKLHRTALYLCSRPHEAEDLVQETLIDGYLHLSSLREYEKIEAWLTQILKHKALRQIIRASRTELMDELPETPDHHTPDTLCCENETMREWYNRLQALSPALRETALLFFWHDLTMEEIARQTDTPLGTVKGRIHAAREKLRKDFAMSDQTKTNLPDTFAEALEKKIRELANYHKLYGSNVGFDSAYKSIKELITNLSDKDDVKKYACRSADIAAGNDPTAYSEEALAVYKKYGEASRAAYLYLDVAWKLGSDKEKADYLRSVALPALEEYPENAEWHDARGYLRFWMARHILVTDGKGGIRDHIDEAEHWFKLALEDYEQVTTPTAMYGCAKAAVKGIPLLRDGRVMQDIRITGELWKVTKDNITYANQPGFSEDSDLYRFVNYIFYYAGYTGDLRFFPHTVPVESGASEVMTDWDGKESGIRRVVATDETVVTPAGVFENCVHIEKTEQDGYTYNAWYKGGVGLVKSMVLGSALRTKVLASYEIRGGDGLLPLCVGNKWVYETPERPDAMVEQNEYMIEQSDVADGEGSVSVSCLTYAALEPDWEDSTNDTNLLFACVSARCGEGKFSEAADRLRNIIIANRDRESVDCALSVLNYLEEKIRYDNEKWRFCPSSANISELTLQADHSRMSYGESDVLSCVTGVWGSRGEENRIFGVKPFRYLQMLTGTLWDDRWVPGYTEKHAHPWEEDATVTVKADEGGRIEVPAGVFEHTLHLTIEAGDTDAPKDTDYFFSHTEMGRKEFWFAPGVGVVRFVCQWGRHIASDCHLTAYRAVAANGEMMPIHIGNRWQYDEVNLTGEGYIARRTYEILSGMGSRYLLGDHQMFTFRGTAEAYEAYKASLVK